MRVMGRMIYGTIAVYEVISFQCEPAADENCILCLLTDGMYLRISWENQNASIEQIEKYCMEMFSTGYINLVNEPVKIVKKSKDVSVAINTINSSFLEGHRLLVRA